MKVDSVIDDSYTRLYRTDIQNKDSVTIVKNDEFSCIMFFTGYEISAFVNDLLSYAEESAKFNRNKNWDGRVRLFNPKNKQFPIGFKNMVVKALVKEGYLVAVDNRLTVNKFFKDEDDLRNQISNWDVVHKLYDHQVKGLYKMINNGKCTVISITGSGKSLIMYMAVRYILNLNLKHKILIIVPLASLVAQLYKQFCQYENDYFVQTKTEAVTTSISNNLSKNVIISTYQMFNTLDVKQRKKILSLFDGLFVDEVHITGMDHMLKYCVNAKFRYGLTGTIEELKFNVMRLIGYFGSIETISKYTELKDLGIVSKINVNAVKLNYGDKAKSRFIETIQQEINTFRKYSIANSKNPNLPSDFIYRFEKNFINNTTFKHMVLIELAVKLAKKGRNVIMLFQMDLSYQEFIFEKINTLYPEFVKNKNLFTVNGGVKVVNRELIRGFMEQSGGNILLANVVFSAGIDIKRLDDLILCEIGKSKNFSLQAIGRIMRVDINKNSANVWDFVDDIPPVDNSASYSNEHFSRRIKLYKAEGYEIRACEFKDIGEKLNIQPLINYFLTE